MLCTSLRQAVFEKQLIGSGSEGQSKGQGFEVALKLRPSSAKYSFGKGQRDLGRGEVLQQGSTRLHYCSSTSVLIAVQPTTPSQAQAPMRALQLLRL
jgi:hypothetical protein